MLYLNDLNNPRNYKYTSTKEYHNAFPCAYRQWRADSHCNTIHGYSFSMKFYFGTNDLDVRNWAADYGGLKELKKILEDQFKEAAKILQNQASRTPQEAAIVAAYEDKNNQFKRSLKLLEKRIKEEEKINKTLGVTGILLTGISKIPIVGPLLKTNEALDVAREKAKAGGNAFQVMGAGLASMGKSLASSLTDPLAVIGLMVAAFKGLLELGFKLDKQVVGLQKAFYSSRVEAELLQEKFQENVDTNNVLVKGLNDALLSRENQTEAAIQLSNAMGAVGRLTDQEIQSQMTALGEDTRIHAVIFNGGTGIAPRDTTYDAIEKLLDKTLPGFGELFRSLSYQEIGSRAMASRAVAGVYQNKIIFSLPGSSNAVRLGMKKLILPELVHLVKQVNFENRE
jgi:molybdenum cofactor synthesis domain-containing protein